MTSPLEVLVTKNCVTGCRKSRQVPLLFETLRDALQDGEKLSLTIFHALQLHVFSLSLARCGDQGPGVSGQVSDVNRVQKFHKRAASLCQKSRVVFGTKVKLNCRLSYKNVFSSNEPLVYSSEATQ